MVLFLSDVSGTEVLVILLFVLIFFGPKSIPGIAKTLGKTMRQIRDASDDLQSELRKTGMDIKSEMKFDQILKDTVNEIERPINEEVKQFHQSVNFEPPTRFEVPVVEEVKTEIESISSETIEQLKTEKISAEEIVKEVKSTLDDSIDKA